MNKYAEQMAKILAQAEEDGFQRGWQAARDALSDPTKIKVAGSAPQTTGSKKKPAKKSALSEILQGFTVEKRVLDCIADNPGNTGATIIAMLADVNPRTARTMLRRLRLAGTIEKRGEGWFKK